jgi:hypothetical protein
MNAEERESLIDRYEHGHAEVLDALAGIDEDGWSLREAPGEWSVREIVHHLGDSEMAAAFRIRLILAEDSPIIHGYAQEAFARHLHYDLPVEPSLAAFAAARASTAPLLRSLSGNEWQRAGTHTEFGPMSAETWLSWYGVHAHDHADQIRRARAAR